MSEVLTLRCRHGEIDDLTEKLWERGTLGLQEIELDGGMYEVQAWFDERFDGAQLTGFIGWHQAAEIVDWQAAWQPVAVGDKLWVAPRWRDEDPPEGRLRVNIQPGQGSGTGYSEPTLLMLEILEREVRPDDVFADIGTGSGILTAAAHALGVRRLLACDIDATSAAAAAETLSNDGITANIWCGSPRSLATNSATLVAANLNAIQLEALAPELLRILAPGGRLILGGFTERNLATIRRAFPGQHRHFTRGPWQALAL